MNEPEQTADAYELTCPTFDFIRRDQLQSEVGKLLGRGHYMWYALRCVADTQPGMTVEELRGFLDGPS